jgi:Zn-dependent protease
VAETGKSVYPAAMTANGRTPDDRYHTPEEDYVEAEVAEPGDAARPSGQQGSAVSAAPSPPPRRRRKRLPLILFLITCASTFWVGAVGWLPGQYLLEWQVTQDAMRIRRLIVSHWQDGMIYMGCLLGILLTHEMGHFLTTLRHRIPASLPFFLPFPISPFGTMGAVIGMEGMRANRKEMFDIGLAGPLAGLIVAVPVLLIGIGQLDLTTPEHGPFKLDTPLSVRLILEASPPPGYKSGDEVWYSQLNPFYMAGWVGLLITGLNMLPVSQLDGGHVIYTLFGKRSHWIARGFMIAAVAYIIWAKAYAWLLMVVLVLLIGTDHPPTRDDTVPLGWFRTVLGLVSLLIPLLCFPPQVLKLVN